MSRILVVTPVPTLPADAGNRARIKTMLDALERAGHTIVILHALRERGDVEAMQQRWGNAYIPVAYREPKGFLAPRLRRLSKRLGLERAYVWDVDAWYDPALDQQITRAINAWNIDVVLAEYVFFSKALEAVPDGILKILDTHDRFANRHRRFLDAGLEPAWFSCSTKAEARGIQRADLVLAIQDNEAEYFRGLTSQRVATVGHLVELAEVSPGHYPGNKTALIVGSANSINIDSTRWYLREVWPQVASQVPGATLRIAGGICTELSCDDPSVRLLGRVDDLTREYQQVQLVINPMLTGTGLKIKTIEAMGAGKAVLSTASGAEGLGSAIPDALTGADGAQSMTQETIALLRDAQRCATLGLASRAFAATYNENCLATFSKALAG